MDVHLHRKVMIVSSVDREGTIDCLFSKDINQIFDIICSIYIVFLSVRTMILTVDKFMQS